VEDETRLSNGVGLSKQDERQMGTTDGSRMKSEPVPVDIWAHAIVEGVQIHYDRHATPSVQRVS
jgi:hypothetical protein